ncbi:hypothetical protein OAC89_04170 [Deltaproteobacteria bacterium]|nr:hypothetical protein [Deltaproteobacteria bacterium]
MMTKKRVFSSTVREEGGSAKLESIMSASILSLLILIGILIFFQQFRFDKERFTETFVQSGLEDQVREGGTENQEISDIAGFLPEGFIPMSDPEYFDQVSLSDKINGKADKYLEANFVRLLSQRFVESSNQANWFEFYLYDMEEPRNAYYVYSSQKREDGLDEDFTRFGYSTENSIFFTHGKFYSEIIASQRDESLIRAMIEMSAEFIKKYPETEVELPELDYLPAENLVSGSTSLILLNGFGFEKFNDIFAGIYQLGGHRIMAFISLRENPEEAESLAKNYDNFISEFIGPVRINPETDQIPGIVIADIFDEYEIFFYSGRLLAGVHAAPDIKLGEQIAVNLYKKIRELEK